MKCRFRWVDDKMAQSEPKSCRRTTNLHRSWAWPLRGLTRYHPVFWSHLQQMHRHWKLSSSCPDLASMKIVRIMEKSKLLLYFIRFILWNDLTYYQNWPVIRHQLLGTETCIKKLRFLLNKDRCACFFDGSKAVIICALNIRLPVESKL